MGPSLEHTDLVSRIYVLACQFSMEVRITGTIQARMELGNSGSVVAAGQELRTVLDELSIRLDSTFNLTSEQSVSHCLYHLSPDL